MKKRLNVLITGAGAPGIIGTIYSLRNNYDHREFNIITTDANSDVIGKFISDKFFVVPLARRKEEYLKAILNICKSERISLIVPQNTAELELLSSKKSLFYNIGVQILLSNKKAISRANNKYELLKSCVEIGVPTAQFSLVRTFEELKNAAMELGWPNKKVVIKPPSLNGSRGVRIIDESIDLKELFYKYKPNSMFATMESLEDVLGETFPDLIVMEYLPGDEYTVDVLRKGDFIEIVPRTRDLVRSGITFNGSLVENKAIIDMSKSIADYLDLEYCFGFQFKIDDLGQPIIIECNPRVQGTMVMSTLAGANLIYSGLKLLLDEEIPDFNINWDSKFYRYWGGIEVNPDGIIDMKILK